MDIQTDELYTINEDVPVPKLDLADDNLLDGRGLTRRDQRNYASLTKELGLLNGSTGACDGDGNLDRMVDARDVIGWIRFAIMNGGKSSWYDFNLDGLTNEVDVATIIQNYGSQCKGEARIRAVTDTAE